MTTDRRAWATSFLSAMAFSAIFLLLMMALNSAKGQVGELILSYYNLLCKLPQKKRRYLLYGHA